MIQYQNFFEELNVKITKSMAIKKIQRPKAPQISLFQQPHAQDFYERLFDSSKTNQVLNELNI